MACIGHGTHSRYMDDGRYLPAGHVWQAMRSCVDSVPSGQSEHSLLDRRERYSPAGHWTHCVRPSLNSCPTEQVHISARVKTVLFEQRQILFVVSNTAAELVHTQDRDAVLNVAPTGHWQDLVCTRRGRGLWKYHLILIHLLNANQCDTFLII